jgi:DNA invertase Pin-like site-specific DNA recombinase
MTECYPYTEEYCLYLRKSRADMELEAQGAMETLKRHESMLIDMSKKKNLPITKIYKEIVSGETISARPVVQQLLEEVEQGRWSGVLVVEVERLARGDTIDQGIVARAFKVGQAKIITPTKTYDPNNEFDEEYFEFGLFMSRREYKTISRRIQRGRKASAQEGKFLGSTPPFGYDKVKIQGEKGYTLAPNKDAETVQLIYRLYLQGIGAGLIANKLDNMQKSPLYSKYWSKATISNILKNPTYIGKTRWGYLSEKTFIDNGSVLKKRCKSDDYIYVDGIHPAIITPETFEKAQQERLKSTHKNIKPLNVLRNPLTGLVKCKICGASMTRICNTKNSYDSLYCSNNRCNNVSAPIYLVENKIIKILNEWSENYEVTYPLISITNNKDNERFLKTLKISLNSIDSQIAKTYDFLEQGIYTTEVFAQRNSELAKRKASLLNEISELEESINKSNNNIELIPKVRKVLNEYYELTDAKEKNELLHNVISKIEYQKEKANTKGNINNDNFELNVYPKLY